MSETKQIRYGNWLSDAPTKIAGLSVVAMLVSGAVVVLALFMLLAGQWIVAIVLLVLLGVFLLLFAAKWGDQDAGRSIVERMRERGQNRSRRASGEATYSAGPFSNLPAEEVGALPGALVDIAEIDGRDGTNEPYTLLHHRTAGVIAAVLQCTPDGIALQPQDSVNTQVSRFGGWLSLLSRDSSIEGATIVVDSSLTSSGPMVERIHAEIAPAAPLLAQQHTLEAAQLMPARVSNVDVYATIAWRRDALDRDLASATADIAARLPEHRDTLYAGGAGRPHAAVSEELARVVQVAYNPHRSHEFGTDDLAGRPPRLRLTEAGPDWLDESGHRHVMFHDGVASLTVMMMVPPRMHITESMMATLFEPADKFLRKRVAIFYRPLTSGEAVKKAQNLRRGTNFAAGTAGAGPTSSFTKHKIDLANKTEAELVTGATMLRMMIEVTVTFEATEKAYREAKTRLKGIMDSVNIAFRYVEANKSAAFHSTLPLGVLPWRYTSELERLEAQL